jgi:CBS domain-containing protein
MQARDIMSRKLVTVREDTPLNDAARLMVDRQVSGLPVVNDAGELLGIMTERDLLLRHEAIRLVRDVMVRHVITAEESATYMDLVEILLQHNIKRVPIVRGGRLVGVVSRTDLIRGQLALETAARS